MSLTQTFTVAEVVVANLESSTKGFAVKFLAASLFVLASTGCAVDGASSTTGDTGTAAPVAPHLDMRLTDAPGAFEKVWVNITKVEIESADTGWITLADEPQKYDLLTLQNDVTAALGGTTLEPGTYGQLRLLVDSASVVIAGVESPMTIASGAQTGIKIPLDSTFEENMTYSLTLDYDAAKSVKTTGQGFLMTPVIQVKDLVATPVPVADGSAAEAPIQ